MASEEDTFEEEMLLKLTATAQEMHEVKMARHFSLTSPSTVSYKHALLAADRATWRAGAPARARKSASG